MNLTQGEIYLFAGVGIIVLSLILSVVMTIYLKHKGKKINEIINKTYNVEEK